MTGSLSDRLEEVTARIDAAAKRSGRKPGDVKLVAVSKTRSPEAIKECLAAGATDLGESRAQELKQKFAVLGDRASWHFIGHLQTNKVRQVVGVASLIHSVDRYGVAEAMGARSHFLGRMQRVLIEVNVSGESAKYGVEPARALALAEEVAGLEGLQVAGLMTMAPFSEDPEASRPYFDELRQLGARLQQLLPDAKALSMGMTRDFEVAVQEGATLVRVGEAIFGARL